MIASIRRQYTTASNIKTEHIDQPIPAENKVLVKVHATTVNRTDCANLTAKPFIMRFVLGLLQPKTIIIGTDFAGEVIAVGANIKLLHIGDNVFGFSDAGAESQAE
ncbi:MAG TPA: NAD(P)-dependent alcohol dehydrogenase, partial [Bacteroidetes bacterium]|nr:NAD(P)-dependent alcohol dehydrogenase [Bacteroidota bacterium]